MPRRAPEGLNGLARRGDAGIHCFFKVLGASRKTPFIHKLERHYLPEAFKEFTEMYMVRCQALTQQLLKGQLHAAKASCKLDFIPG